MLTTTLWARLVRAAIVIGSLVLAALVGVVASADFRDAVSELVGDATWATLICGVLVAVLTQLVGHLAGKTDPDV